MEEAGNSLNDYENRLITADEDFGSRSSGIHGIKHQTKRKLDEVINPS